LSSILLPLSLFLIFLFHLTFRHFYHSVCLLFLSVWMYLSVYLSVYLLIRFAISPSTHPSIRPFIHPSIHQSYSSTHSPTHPSIHPSMSAYTRTSIESLIHHCIQLHQFHGGSLFGGTVFCRLAQPGTSQGWRARVRFPAKVRGGGFPPPSSSLGIVCSYSIKYT
jgi:hypothetical protein